MARNEIRLRRQSVSSGRIAKHRNYEELMERHARDQRMRRLSVILTYFMIGVIVIVSLIFFMRWEKMKKIKTSPHQETALPKQTAARAYCVL